MPTTHMYITVLGSISALMAGLLFEKKVTGR